MPPPAPRWFPWRRGFLDGPGRRVVEADAGEGTLARASLGQVPQLGGWHSHLDERSPAVRVDQGGWSWAVLTSPPVDDGTARRIVEGVLQGRPYDEPS